MEKGKIALVSVYNKDGIVEFVKDLVTLGWKIISSGGTAAALKNADVPVTDIAEITGLPPILGHRVVTLAPQIHGGLLAAKEHLQELEKYKFPWIGLVCCDLYPLKQEIAKEGSTRASVIEKTDIGGPTMIRSGAKGRRIVIADVNDRGRVLTWLKEGQPDREEFVNRLAAKAEGIIADYCLASARYHSAGAVDGIVGTQVASCKYGENAYQTPAGLYENLGEDDPLALSKFKLLEGTPPSYNNWCDVDRLLQTMTHIAAGFEVNFGKVPFIAIGVKHGNPCGAAVGESALTVLEQMLMGDPLAIFGGLVMTNFPIGDVKAKCLREFQTPGKDKRMLDAVIAPSICDNAEKELARKGGKCRLIVNPALLELGVKSLDRGPRLRRVRGGFLKQPNYTFVLNLEDPRIVKTGELTPQQKSDIVLAWAIGCTSNSNTITLVKDNHLIGNGVGQQDRVSAAMLACVRAERGKHSAEGAVAYSDSFFPFPDGPEFLAEAGVKALFASSGSVKDGDTIKVCSDKKVALWMMPDADCRGFFGH